MRQNKTVKILLLFFLSIAFAVFVSFVFRFWAGYPKGGDAFAHSLKIFWVEKFFPHHNWWNVWASGMPLFIFYPIGSTIILAFFARILSISPELVMSIGTVFALGLTGFFIALLGYKYSDNFYVSLLVSFINISTPGFWVTAVGYGGYSRALAVPLLVAAVYFAANIGGNAKNKPFVFGTIVSLALSFYFHTLIGLLASFLVGILILVIIEGIKKKFVVLVGIFLPLFFLSASYLVPLRFFSLPSNYNIGFVSFGLNKVATIPVANVFGLTKVSISGNTGLDQSFSNLTPFVLPLALILIFLTFFLKRQIFTGRTIWFFLLGLFGSFLFCTVKIPFFAPAYLTLGAVGGLFFVVFFATGITAILLGSYSERFSNAFSLTTILLLFFWLWFSFSPNITDWRKEIYAAPIEGGWKQLMVNIRLPDKPEQFRFGDNLEPGLAMVFNRVYPEYPQTRDYFANGNINSDFGFYFTKAIWSWKDNLDESRFLFDWWSVDKFVINKDSNLEGSGSLSKFTNPDFGLSDLGGFNLYSISQPSPILSAVNTPSVLFIGSSKDYTLFFQALAQANVNSGELIPLLSTQTNMRRLDISELRKFSAVFLYHPQIPQDEWEILKKYVEEGGHLLIEGPADNTSNLPGVYPMARIDKAEVIGKWTLTSQGNIEKTDFSKFAPPIFENGPWGIGIAKDTYPWAKVLMTESGRPVVVAGELGKGAVIWSGLNTIYHATVFKNREESLFLKTLFNWLTGERMVQEPQFQVKFINPERRQIALGSSAAGILFKENYFPNWHAKINSKETKIYEAGPNFMYVPLKDAKAGDVVTFEYRTHPIQILSNIVSLVTLAGLVLWLFDWWIFKPYVVGIKQKLVSPFKNISRWWGREEE